MVTGGRKVAADQGSDKTEARTYKDTQQLKYTKVQSLVPTQTLIWDGTLPPKYGHALGTRRPVREIYIMTLCVPTGGTTYLVQESGNIKQRTSTWKDNGEDLKELCSQDQPLFIYLRSLITRNIRHDLASERYFVLGTCYEAIQSLPQ